MFYLKKKFFCKAFTGLATIAVIASITTIPSANAAGDKHYEKSIIRTCGVDWLESCKSVFNWVIDGDFNFKGDSSAYQVVKGINVQKGGTVQTYKGNHEHDWSAITEETVGISFKGINIGPVRSYDDRVSLMNSGQLWVDWD